jgi:DNA-binding LacI/PurR family transcriptional regulator
MAKASITDVAQRANVSIATVSRVLNNNDRVKPRLRQRVLQAMEELQYEPSGIARNMRNQSKKAIGLVIADIQNPFFTDLVRAIEESAYALQYTVLLGNSGDQPARERLYLDILAKERLSGLIVIPLGDEAEAYRFKRSVPLVFVDRTVPGVQADAVVLDNVRGGYEATKHLLELGHRRIGVIAAPPSFSVGNERCEGYRQALQEYGIPANAELIRSGESPKEKGGYIAAQELLSLEPPPTAVFAVNNVRTLGMLQAVQECGRQIPQDISVIGFDDSPWLSLLTPPLTTVRQPIYEMGVEATRLLMQRIAGGEDSPTVVSVVQPKLVVRSSTGPAQQESG